jgi:hypothetical protein
MLATRMQHVVVGPDDSLHMEVLKEQRSDQNVEPLFDPSLQGPINLRDILLRDASRAFP